GVAAGGGAVLRGEAPGGVVAVGGVQVVVEGVNGDGSGDAGEARADTDGQRVAGLARQGQDVNVPVGVDVGAAVDVGGGVVADEAHIDAAGDAAAQAGPDGAVDALDAGVVAGPHVH